MNILHVVKKDLDATEQKIVDEQSKAHETIIFDVRSDKDFDRLVDLVESCDKVISW